MKVLALLLAGVMMVGVTPNGMTAVMKTKASVKAKAKKAPVKFYHRSILFKGKRK